MCRHLAYLGPSVPLRALLVEPPHALVHQARQARLQSSGSTNPDGYGVAWYDAVRSAPHRYRTATPIWDDPRLDELAAAVAAPTVVAAVRLASPGLPVHESGNAPFVADRFAFSHNGIVDGWHDGAGIELRKLLSNRRGGGVEGDSDAETLFALSLDRLDAGASLGEALVGLLDVIEARTGGRFNFLLTDGAQLAATACGNSLFIRVDDDGVVAASEPLDDAPGWHRVPDRTLVTVDSAGPRYESV